MAFADSAGLHAAQAFLAGAPDIIAKLQAAGMVDEAALVQGMHGAATDIVAKLGAVVASDLAPVIEEARLWRGEISALNTKLDRLLNGGLLLTVPCLMPSLPSSAQFQRQSLWPSEFGVATRRKRNHRACILAI